MSYLINSSAVCSSPDSDDCTCALAKLANSSLLWTECFGQLICPFDTGNGEFCDGRGICIYSDQECDCDNGYGLNDDDNCEAYEKYDVSDSLLTGMLVLGSLLLALCCGLLVWVYIYRQVSEVKAMSIVFTQLTIVGFIIGACAVITIGSGYNEATCVLLEWFTFVGVTLILGCAGLKAFRISSIFNRQAFSPMLLTDQQLLKYLGIIMCPTVFLLTIYSIVNYLEGGAYFRKIDEDLVKEKRCSSEPWTMVCYSLLVAYTLALLILVLKFGNDSKIASNVFKETKCIYLGSNTGTVIFISFGIFIMFTTNYTLQIAIRGYGTLMTLCLWIGLLFVPKFAAVYASEKVGDDGLTEKERLQSTQYRINLKERSGKELLLVLNTLVDELATRTKLKIIKLELKDVHIEQLTELLEELRDLLDPQRLKSQSSAKSITPNDETPDN